MNNQANDRNAAEQNAENQDKAGEVNIQPSEPEKDSADSEENAPGRTPGKAEGSDEIVEADLADRKN